MNIIHVTQYFHPDKGYQENNLSAEQVKLGHKVAIVCSDDLSLWAKTETEKQVLLNSDLVFSKTFNVKIIRVKKFMKISDRIFSFGIGSIIRTENPDLLFLHGIALPFTFISLFSIRKIKAKKIKIIIDDHMVNAGSFNNYSKLFYKLFKPILRISLKLSSVDVTKWVAVSKETKTFMRKNYGIKEKIELIPLGYNGANCYYDEFGKEEWRKQNELPLEKDYILYIGKCDKYKNPIDLLEPFSLYNLRKVNSVLLIVGEMNLVYGNKFKERVMELGINDKVFIRPPIKNEDMRKVFSLAYMAIWPHGSSMAMLEAMSCNCPVIAPEIDVNIERLSGSRGLMFKDLGSDLINKMLLIDELRDTLVQNASDWVNEYEWKSLNTKFLEGLN